MNGRRVERGLWMATGVLLLTAGTDVWRAARGTAAVPIDLPPGLSTATASISGDALDAAVGAVTAHDPFRLARHPSPLTYRPELEGVGAPPAPPKPPKPLLVLTGILGGPPWEALIEGIPDHAGATVVRAGDVFADLRVRAVRRDNVVIQGADTTWHLGLTRSWP